MWSDACNLQLIIVLDFCFRRFLLYGIYGKQFCMDENNVILSVSSHFPIKNIVNYNFRYFTCINYKDSSISRSCNLMKPLIWDYLTNLEHTLIGVTSNSLFCIHEVQTFTGLCNYFYFNFSPLHYLKCKKAWLRAILCKLIYVYMYISVYNIDKT